MKKMKIALASMLVAAGITATAGAANFTNCADRLKDVGLFQGTNQGYQLDRAPTRAEASAMLVRLLGKEEEAKSLTYTAPFTDLVGWEKPYVQYLYDNGLANGTSATTYNPSGKCSAQMYTTFLLRALNYSDKHGDFSYAEALDFGEARGLVDAYNCNTKNFLRDNVAAMSLTALGTEYNDGSHRLLLDKLIGDGAVDKRKAASLTDFFVDAEAFNVAAENSAADTKTAMDLNMSMHVAESGKTMYSLTMPMSIKTDMNLTDLDKSKMEMTGKMSLKLDPSLAEGGQTDIQQDIKYYYTNGVYYMDMGAAGKTKMAMSFDDVLNGMDMASLNSDIPASLINKITKNGNTMTVTYNMDGMFGSELFDELFASLTDGVKISVKDLNVTATVTGGKITSSALTGDINITALGTTMTASVSATAKVTATGDSVKVTLPTDLSAYTDINDMIEGQ